MGSTRQIFSQDRPAPATAPWLRHGCSLAAPWLRSVASPVSSCSEDWTQHKRDSSDYQVLLVSWNPKQTKKIFGQSGQSVTWKSATTSNWTTKAQYQMKTWTNIYFEQCIFWQGFLVSLQQKLSVDVFQTKSIFFNVLKSDRVLIFVSCS